VGGGVTPSWTVPWVVAAIIVALFLVAAGFRFRLRAAVPRGMPSRGMVVHGPPVTPEMQQLLGSYGGGKVVGVVQLRDGLQVGYESGVQLTFVPVHTGGKVGGLRE
jgi:hypothetical protein